MKERWMGLDYGTKTVGVAVSDALGITAQGVETITRKSNKKLRQTLARIEALAEEYEVSRIVLGLPIIRWEKEQKKRKSFRRCCSEEPDWK